MKLRNLFLASLAVCTMASCSKDDDGISGPQEVDAYLSFASTADVMTKASTEKPDDSDKSGTGKEATIQSLTAYVFDANGKYVISKHVALTAGNGAVGEDYSTDAKGTSINSIRGIHVKVAKPSTDGGTSATSFKVVLLANVASIQVTDLDGLKSATTTDIKTFNAVAVGDSYLPMHSDVLTVTGLTPSPTDGTAHILNWCNGSTCVTDSKTSEVHTGEIPTQAGKVVMTRSIARVQLTSLGASFDALQYKDMRFDVSSVFLANVRANATVMGDEVTTAGFYRGAPANFEILQFLIEPTGSVDGSLQQTYDKAISLKDGEKALDATTWKFDKYINANSPESILGIPFEKDGDGYKRVEGDGAYQTRLVISGTLYQGTKALGVKYFHIPLKLVDNAGNVLSNKFFKVSATITGEGSPNEDEILENACISFSIEVAPWNVIEQTEDDTN